MNRLRWLGRAAGDARGVSAIEFAIIAPVLLTMSIGILKFGVAMNSYLMITNGAAKGATAFALSRGTTTPFTTTKAAVTGATSGLIAAQVTVVLEVGGVACTTDSGCSALLVAGQTAVVKTSYPCDLTVMGVNFKPGGCILNAQTAQMVQ